VDSSALRLTAIETLVPPYGNFTLSKGEGPVEGGQGLTGAEKARYVNLQKALIRPIGWPIFRVDETPILRQVALGQRT
jgi:hypothetical protein